MKDVDPHGSEQRSRQTSGATIVRSSFLFTARYRDIWSSQSSNHRSSSTSIAKKDRIKGGVEPSILSTFALV